jgi:hypothetical protein
MEIKQSLSAARKIFQALRVTLGKSRGKINVAASWEDMAFLPQLWEEETTLSGRTCNL